ncbi:4291_t:CDS:2, partial [Ambispora gerdemannii]
MGRKITLISLFIAISVIMLNFFSCSFPTPTDGGVVSAGPGGIGGGIVGGPDYFVADIGHPGGPVEHDYCPPRKPGCSLPMHDYPPSPITDDRVYGNEWQM